jgi:hypothetical protein
VEVVGSYLDGSGNSHGFSAVVEVR